MPKERKERSEVVSDVAARTERAAAARANGLPTSAEAPRDVYAAGCRAIADALSADGFAYAESKHTRTRKRGNFNFRLSFYSSHNNVPGELVALEICATVASPKLWKWAKTNPNLSMKRWDRVA